MSSVLGADALIQAQRLAQYAEEDGDLETRCLLGWLHWYRYQALPEGEDQHDLGAAIDQFTHCFIADVEHLPEPLLPVLAERAAPIAIAITNQVLDSADESTITAIVELHERILDATAEVHPDRCVRLSYLAMALLIRFDRAGAAGDLEAAIKAGRSAVDSTPADHPGYSPIRNNLGRALQTKYRESNASEDLDSAIEVIQEAVDATPADDAQRTSYLKNLASLLRVRYLRAFPPGGALDDLDTVIWALREAVDATPAGHPGRPEQLSDFAIMLRFRFERTSEPADLEDVISALREAVDTTPSDDPQLAMYKFNLGSALQTRFDRIGAVGDANAFVESGQELVDGTPAGHPRRVSYLENLGRARLARFDRTGELEDVDASIRAYEEAVDAAPADDPQRIRHLVDLGHALQARFLRTGRLADSDSALTVVRQTVDATVDDRRDHARCLSNLGNALQARFGRTGALDDLDTAIEALQEAVEATPANDVDQATVLSNLGIALSIRFERTGARRDLDSAIEFLQHAVDATPADHRNRSGYLSNLGSALIPRYRRTGALADLDSAIRFHREAVEATPHHHPHRALLLHNLGYAFASRFENTGALEDLDTSIRAIREAVDGTADDAPDRALYLENLGDALWIRFERTGALGDLDTGINTLRVAVDATPPDHPRHARLLFRLGGALRTKFGQTGVPSDLEAAASAYADAAEGASAPPSIRIHAAQAAAELIASAEPARAAGLLEDAVRLLPEVAPRRLERGDQQHAIGKFAGLAADAAALAMADPGIPTDRRAVRALRLLEAGRTVLLSQALDTRSDLSALRDQHPELAARFTDLRERLDGPVDALSPIPAPQDGNGHITGFRTQQGLDRRHLADDITATLTEIRALEGFVGFGLPPATEELLAEAESGPVVVFNVSSHRSDALLLTTGGITPVALPALTHDTVIDQVNAFHRTLHTALDSNVMPVDRMAAQARLRTILEWLWDTTVEPVLSALGHNGLPLGDDWPRVWWSPGGLLGLLPIHAAGYHTEPSGQEPRTVMDRVVSSYTPTIRALRHARQRARVQPTPRDRAMIIAMSATPGLPDQGRLPNVSAEAAMLRARVPNSVLFTEPGVTSGIEGGGVATKTNVLTHLPSCTIAHFACHGYSDPTDPSSSQLLLHDHLDDPLNVTSLASIALDNARLAYLSACSTALTADTNLLDEAIHLASAFQIAGFPHVIGTLWEINDQLAVKIAKSFYTDLTTGDGSLNTDRAAHALHRATRIARDQYPATPSLWAAYLHAGA
ncbi:CHAT domain-containing tetratricopeptide repeat protein [Streptomyces sp. NPDC002133]|uniref:CHAT domain-containing protein n=1 Tax=Streptomyces sp. NPDC002133 TaxID=3154409 RepID=UPI0033272F14